MTKTLIVPGLDGSPVPHWQHWWAATDPRALMVDLSDALAPRPAVWEAELIDLGFAGHINVASGFGPWPEGKALRDRLVHRPVVVRHEQQEARA